MRQLLISNKIITKHCRSVYKNENVSALFLQFSRHLIALLVAITTTSSPVADTSSAGTLALMCACAYTEKCVGKNSRK